MLSPVEAKITECALCKEKLTSSDNKLPRIMLCCHIFCQECIEKHVRVKESSVITCPLMCKASILAIQNVKDVKIHNPLIQLLKNENYNSKSRKVMSR